MSDREASAAQLLERSECRRVAASEAVGATATRSEHGQFFTPMRAAALLASMPRIDGRPVRLLDPGAGTGILSAAWVARWIVSGCDEDLEVVAVEQDPLVVPFLQETLQDCQDVAAALGVSVSTSVVEGDYIELSTGLAAEPAITAGFDLVIQNPPYMKLAASSPHRGALRQAGVDTPNTYAAFLALAGLALRPGGQMVAITPRSFCNGPYFGDFRRYLLDRVSIDRVHVFQSRSTIFADTAVLQENVVISSTVGGRRESVLVSESQGDADDPLERQVPYSDVVRPGDVHRFIRIATSDLDTETAERIIGLPSTMDDLGVTVSTGKVVDFRSRSCLREERSQDGVPLIYPGNLRSGRVEWPLNIRKPQWFVPEVAKDDALLIPEGWYCVVKRFSAKEERRRIVAAVWSPLSHPGPIAVENHINVLHAAGSGLDRDLACGLSLWLNSSPVDRFFRTFSGHTQVNATDLRTLRFPDAAMLRRLGESAPEALPDQQSIDELVDDALSDRGTAA